MECGARGEAAIFGGAEKALICFANQWIGREAPNRGFAAPDKQHIILHALPSRKFGEKGIRGQAGSELRSGMALLNQRHIP